MEVTALALRPFSSTLAKRVECHWVCRGVFRVVGLNVFSTELTRAEGLRKTGTVLWHLLLSTVSQLPPSLFSPSPRRSLPACCSPRTVSATLMAAEQAGKGDI